MNGDVNPYQDPRKPEPVIRNTTDHETLFGLEVLNFDSYRAQLDKLIKEQDIWRGFAPRWTIPVSLRNPTTKKLTSALLMVIDSKREIEQGIGPSFSQRPIGLEEMMVSH